MIGVIGETEHEEDSRWAESLGGPLIECLFEGAELIPYAVVLLTVVFGLYLVGMMVYGLVFDPNAVNVTARLDLLSIDPDKWIRRS